MTEDYEEIVVTEQDEIEAEEAMKVLDTNRKFVEDKLKESTKQEKKMAEWLKAKWVVDPEGFKQAFFKNTNFDVKDHDTLMKMCKTIRMKHEIMVAMKALCQTLLDEDSYAFFEDLSTSEAQLEFAKRVCQVRDALFFR